MSTITTIFPASPDAQPAPAQTLATAAADLAAALQTLHLVAVETLTRLLRTESDPQELRRLLAIAFKGPRLPAEPRTGGPAPVRTRRVSEGRAFGSAASSEAERNGTGSEKEKSDQDFIPSDESRESFGNAQRSSSCECLPDSFAHPKVDRPVEGPARHEKEAAPSGQEAVPPPQQTADPDPSLTAHIYTPMSDAEYLTLTRDIGLVEAQRRRAIRAHLAAQHAQSKGNRQHDDQDADDSS